MVCQPAKFFIDYDKKMKNDHFDSTDPGEQESEIRRLRPQQLGHKNDILNIINHVKSVLPNVTAVYVLKSIPDTTTVSLTVRFDL